MWILYISCSWVAGIFLGSKASFTVLYFITAFLPLCFLSILPKFRSDLITVSLCLVAFFGGALYYTSTLPQIGEHTLQFYNDKGELQFHGMVAKEPDIRDNYCLLTLSVSGIEATNGEREVSGTALIRTNRYPSYRYGDILSVTGKIEIPSAFSDFDYRSYLSHQNIYSIVNYPEIEMLDRGQGSSFFQRLYLFREHLSASINRFLPEPQASLAQGILLGIRGNIPDQLYHQFSITGTAHLLAISGLHISIIIIIFFGISIFIIGRQSSFYIWVVLLVTWLYALLVGMRPPIIRAATMATLFLIAELLGRQRSAITALAFAASVMLAINPQILWSSSFQLSFTAMCGIIFLYPHFYRLGNKGIIALLAENNKIIAAGNVMVTSFAATLAGIMAIWPIAAYYFQIISFVALPANLFALPALPFILVSSALVSISGVFFPFAATIFGWISWLSLSYLLLVIQSFATSRFCYLESNHISTLQIWLYYIILTIVLVIFNNRKQIHHFFSKKIPRLHDNE